MNHLRMMMPKMPAQIATKWNRLYSAKSSTKLKTAALFYFNIVLKKTNQIVELANATVGQFNNVSYPSQIKGSQTDSR